MSARVTKSAEQGQFLVWCEECSDGYHGPAHAAVKWADKHNAARHPKEEQ